MLELLLKKEPFSLSKSSVWNNTNRYYIDGKVVSISSSVFRNADCSELKKELEKINQTQKEKIANAQKEFNHQIEKFIQANKIRLDFIRN